MSTTRDGFSMTLFATAWTLPSDSTALALLDLASYTEGYDEGFAEAEAEGYVDGYDAGFLAGLEASGASGFPYWGPHYPDFAGPAVTSAAAHAQLAAVGLGEGSDNGLYGVIFRARAGGVGGNAITVEVSSDSTGVPAEVIEVGNTVFIGYQSPPAPTVQDVADYVNAHSTLVEMIGDWFSSDHMAAGTDEFPPTHLAGGAPSAQYRNLYWSTHYPDSTAGGSEDGDIVPGVGPEGAAQFGLTLDGTLDVQYEWRTDVFKARSGTEKRASLLSAPRASYRGTAHLLGEAGIRTRAQFQRFAALGSAFLIGLPHEEATIVEDSPTTSIAITTADRDWANPGQRVAIVNAEDETSVIAVIQSVAAGEIVLDEAGGDVATAGSVVMPLAPVVLDPQQGFPRYPANEPRSVEMWQLSGNDTGFGFKAGSVKASLALADPVMVSGIFDLGFIVARSAGVGGNEITISFVADSLSGVDVDDDGVSEVIVHWDSGVSTAGDVADAINASSTLVELVGTWTDSDLMTPGEDEFDPLNLTGGADETLVPVGVGAELATFMGHPIFDRGVDVDGTSEESVHAMTEMLDLGGAISAIGTADVPDWGRQVAMSRSDPSEWQWLKLFLWTVRGRWKTFFLPSHHDDLRARNYGPFSGDPGTGGSGTLTLDADFGDFFAWYPERKYVRVVQDSGTYDLEIQGAQLNVDGDLEIEVISDISTTPPGTMPADEPILEIGWLERVRFESDTMSVSWKNGTFSFKTTARVIQQANGSILVDT